MTYKHRPGIWPVGETIFTAECTATMGDGWEKHMKKSEAWSELVWYVECPECGESHTLGESSPDKEEEMTCDKCEKRFIACEGDQ